MKLKIGIILIVFILFNCGPGEVASSKELIAFVQDEENGLKKSVSANGVDVILVYKPTDLMVAQEAGDKPTEEQIRSFRKKYNDHYYFIMSLSKSGKEALQQADDFSQYSELVQQLSFRVPEFINMTTNLRDTIPVADFILNRTYGIKGSSDVMLVFNKEKSRDKDWVQVNINEFGMSTGNIRIRFNVNDLENCPSLIFNIY